MRLAETKAKRTRTPKAAPTEIVRDSTFSRAVADKAIVLDLGRDVEIACLEAVPELVNIRNKAQVEELETRPVLTEVVRLRLPWSSALSLAIELLGTGISKDMIMVDGLLDAIRSLREESLSASNGNESTDAITE